MAHGELLLRLGCECAQGYGIARPMPPEQLPAWMSSWKPPARWTQQRRLGLEARPLLYAGVEHRGWILAIDAHLDGLRDEPPALDPHECGFGRWLDGAIAEHIGDDDTRLQALDLLHQEVHVLATELLALHAAGQQEAARSSQRRLHLLRDRTIEAIESFLPTF